MRDKRLVVAEINSCAHVQKDTDDEQRGQVDELQIGKLREELKSLVGPEYDFSIKVALVHHHPVVLPGFAEAGRNYDAIIHANKLLKLLQDTGFHLILHGHKHYPNVFSYDVNCSWLKNMPPPMMVVAGGSAGIVGRGLPTDEAGKCNTYNLVTLKWVPEAKTARVRVETRGLQLNNPDGSEMLMKDWYWQTLKVVDRVLAPTPSIPPCSRCTSVPFHSAGVEGKPFEDARPVEYDRLHGNMPVAHVLPSLTDGQTFEARVWLEPHGERRLPMEVIWSAGQKFNEVVRIKREDLANDDDPFCSTIHYWGPMLIECCLTFPDEEPVSTFVYARSPRA
jgi:hypothetical protein